MRESIPTPEACPIIEINDAEVMTVMHQNAASGDGMWAADRRTPYERSSAARSVHLIVEIHRFKADPTERIREMRGNALRCLGQTASGFSLENSAGYWRSWPLGAK